MAMFYSAGFDVSALTTGTITLATAGETDVVVTMSTVTATAGDSTTTSLFNHAVDMTTIVGSDPDGSARFQEFAASTYATALQTALRADATSKAWASPGNIDVTYALATGYTITFTATITVTWSAAVGRQLMGFSSSPQSGASTYSSDETATYVISSTLASVSEPTTSYEPMGVASFASSDSGIGYGISRTTAPLHRDWVQQFETKAKTLRLEAATPNPWTYQHFFEHCRTVYPFIVYNGGFNDTNLTQAFYLREDGAMFKPDRASPGNDTQFHIPFKALVVGSL